MIRPVRQQIFGSVSVLKTFNSNKSLQQGKDHLFLGKSDDFVGDRLQNLETGRNFVSGNAVAILDFLVETRNFEILQSIFDELSPKSLLPTSTMTSTWYLT